MLLLRVWYVLPHASCINADTGTKKVQEAVKGGEGGGRYIPINAVQVSVVHAAGIVFALPEIGCADDNTVSTCAGSTSLVGIHASCTARMVTSAQCVTCACVHLSMCPSVRVSLHVKILAT